MSTKKAPTVREQNMHQLEAERERTIVELNRLREFLKGEVDTDVEEGDPDLHEREKNLALVQNLERKLESIEHALRLAQSGGYGICERCGQQIDPARLKALPQTTLCLKCKMETERLARRRG